MHESLTIRTATERDDDALRLLAALDSAACAVGALRLRRYQILRQGDRVGPARLLLRRLAPQIRRERWPADRVGSS